MVSYEVMGDMDNINITPYHVTFGWPDSKKIYLPEPVYYFQTMSRMFDPRNQYKLLVIFNTYLGDADLQTCDSYGCVVTGTPNGTWICLESEGVFNPPDRLFFPERLMGGVYYTDWGGGRVPPVLMGLPILLPMVVIPHTMVVNLSEEIKREAGRS